MKSARNYPQQYNRKIILTQTLLHVLLTPNINKHTVQWNLHNESVFGRRRWPYEFQQQEKTPPKTFSHLSKG